MIKLLLAIVAVVAVAVAAGALWLGAVWAAANLKLGWVGSGAPLEQENHGYPLYKKYFC